MKMKMKYRLTGYSPIVGEYVKALKVETLGQCLSDCLDGFHDAGERGCRQGQKITTMVLRDDESVSVMNRVDVENAECVTVFVEDFRRGMSRNDVTECALNHVVFARFERRESSQFWF